MARGDILLILDGDGRLNKTFIEDALPMIRDDSIAAVQGRYSPSNRNYNFITRMLALEDMCSVLDLPTSAKYDGTMERVARAVRPLSTAPEEDLLIIVKRALFAWLIADGDMHLKNMALLKIAEPGNGQFRSVRMAPLYDAVTTRVFPKLKHDHLALKLNGKDDNLRRADFQTLATTAGLRAGVAEAAIDELLRRLREAVDRIAVPKAIALTEDMHKLTTEVLGLCRQRIEGMR